MKKRCRSKNRDGKPCGRFVKTGERRCSYHSRILEPRWSHPWTLREALDRAAALYSGAPVVEPIASEAVRWLAYFHPSRLAELTATVKLRPAPIRRSPVARSTVARASSTSETSVVEPEPEKPPRVPNPLGLSRTCDFLFDRSCVFAGTTEDVRKLEAVNFVFVREVGEHGAHCHMDGDEIGRGILNGTIDLAAERAKHRARMKQIERMERSRIDREIARAILNQG